MPPQYDTGLDGGSIKKRLLPQKLHSTLWLLGGKTTFSLQNHHLLLHIVFVRYFLCLEMLSYPFDNCIDLHLKERGSNFFKKNHLSINCFSQNPEFDRYPSVQFWMSHWNYKSLFFWKWKSWHAFYILNSSHGEQSFPLGGSTWEKAFCI